VRHFILSTQVEIVVQKWHGADAPLSDEAVDDVVERLEPGSKALVPWRGHPERWERHKEVLLCLFLDTPGYFRSSHLLRDESTDAIEGHLSFREQRPESSGNMPDMPYACSNEESDVDPYLTRALR
jgi:hypothetical protein